MPASWTPRPDPAVHEPGRPGLRPHRHPHDRLYAWVFEQGQVWVDYWGNEHEIESMSADYIASVIRFCERQAACIRWLVGLDMLLEALGLALAGRHEEGEEVLADAPAPPGGLARRRAAHDGAAPQAPSVRVGQTRPLAEEGGVKLEIYEGEVTTIVVTLSRRNLLALLHKLSIAGSARTLASRDAYRDGELVDDVQLLVRCERDDAHYGSRGFPAGPMHPQTETFIARFEAAATRLVRDPQTNGGGP